MPTIPWVRASNGADISSMFPDLTNAISIQYINNLPTVYYANGTVKSKNGSGQIVDPPPYSTGSGYRASCIAPSYVYYNYWYVSDSALTSVTWDGNVSHGGASSSLDPWFWFGVPLTSVGPFLISGYVDYDNSSAVVTNVDFYHKVDRCIYRKVPGGAITQIFNNTYSGFSTCVVACATPYPFTYGEYITLQPANSAPNAPTITTPNWNMFATPNPTFTWTFSDSDAGDYQTAYWVDLFDGANTGLLSSTGWVSSGTGSHTITGLGNGNYHFRVYTRDKESIQSAYSVIGFTVDIAAPTGNARVGTIYSNVTPRRVYVDNVADNIAGVAYVDAYMLNLAQNNWVYQGRATNAGNGTWYFDYPVGNEGQGSRLTRFHAVDAVSNQSVGFDTWVHYDTIAPTIASAQATQYVNVPNNGTFRVIVYGVDGGISGISRVQFPTWTTANGQDDLTGDWTTNPVVLGINAGGGTWYYDVPINLHNNETGEYNTHVYAFDNAGNMSAGFTVVNYVDRTIPIATVTSPANGLVTSNKRPTLTWTYSDASPQLRYRPQITNAAYSAVIWDGGDIAGTATSYQLPDLGEGTFHARVYVTDAAGNVNDVETTRRLYTVDVTPPTSSGHNFQGYEFGGAANSTSGTLKLRWTYNDNVGAQKAYQVVGSNNEWASWTYDSGQITNANNFHDINFSGLANGYWRFALYVVDQAGNSSPASGGYAIWIDRTLPVVGGVSDQQYTTGDTASVYVSGVSDGQSGIDVINVYQVRPDGTYYFAGTAANWGSNNWGFNATGLNVEGNWRFDFYVFDKAGNQAGGPGTFYPAYVMKDTSKPVIGSSDGDRYSNQSTGTIRHTVSNVSDVTSGVISATFQTRKSLDNGATWDAWGGVFNGTQSGTSWYYDVAISGDGYYETAVKVYDRAGNSNDYLYLHTTVDSVRSNDPDPKVVYGTTSATFTWDAFSDPNPSSGRKYTEFYLYEWDGTTMGLIHHAGDDIGNVTTYTQPGLKEGQRYRYTVAYRDNSGNESAYTYKEFITKKRIGVRKTHGVSGDISLPIYDINSGVLGHKSYRVACDGAIGCYELIDINDPSASAEYINTPQGIKALAKL